MRQAGCGSRLYVIDFLPIWGEAELVDNGFTELDWPFAHAESALERLKCNGDITDMDAYGFYANENGDVWWTNAGCSYLDLEYRRSLVGPDRWAEVVSAHLKREIGFDEAQGLLRFLQIDNEARRLQWHYDGIWRKIRR